MNSPAKKPSATPASIEATKLDALRLIAWLLVAGPLIFLSLLFLFLPAHPQQAVGPLLFLSLASLCLFLIGRKQAMAAALLLIYGCLVAIAVHALASGGGIHTPQLVGLPLGIIMAGWLLGRSHAIAVTVLSVAFHLLLALLDQSGLAPSVQQLPAMLIWLPRAVVAVGVCLLTLFIVQTYEARINEVRRLSDALAEERTQLRAIAENVPALIFHGDRDMRCLFANRQFADFFHGGGVPLEGLHLREILGEAVFEAALPNIARALAGESVLLAGERLSKSGSQRHLEINLVPQHDEQGRVIGFYALKRDITERLRTEQALAESEAQLRLVAENVPAMIAYNDAGMMLRYANRRYLEFFGLDGRTAIGRHIRDIIGTAAFGKAEPMLLRALSGTAVSYRAMRRSAAGEDRIVELEVVPDRDAEGAVRGCYALMRDVTDQQRAEDEVRRLNAELESRVRERTAELLAANRELESFAYSISHDLRAPLRGIDGFTHLLAEEYSDRLDEEGRGYLERVRRAAQRMGTLIDDILELSRVTRQEMRRVKVDLSQIAAELIEEHARSGPERRVDVTLAPDCKAVGDPQLLRVMMQNLLENAWKYSGKETAPAIAFGRETQGGETVFFVRDNGVGFDMQYAERLFAPFERLHKPEEFEGTGIGLATVARVVHRHGGRVWAESSPGQGAVFRFTVG